MLQLYGTVTGIVKVVQIIDYFSSNVNILRGR